MKNKKLTYIFTLLIIVVSCYFYFNNTDSNFIPTQVDAQYTLLVPSDKYPETAAHIKSAEERGESQVCTIDRRGAEENRKESLKGVPTKKGYDRDEWPMAMCSEGGEGADIQYVTPSDNRGAGSWISNQLEKYPDGTKVKILVK